MDARSRFARLIRLTCLGLGWFSWLTWLKRLNSASGFLKFFFWSAVAFISLSLVGLALIGLIFLWTPKATDIKGCLTAQMYQVRLCPKEKSYTRLADIAPAVRHAVIVSEDSSFYQHNGFDFFEIRQSVRKNFAEGGFARGGSTITQQLAKNVYLTAEKSLWRKAKEVLITIQLEKILRKDEILEKYLNVVEFGPHIFGIKAASQFYFQKKPSQLSVLESAWLAFLLPNPKKYSSSYRRRELTRFARSQLTTIIQRMAAFERISQSEADLALDELQHMFKPIADSDQEEDGVGASEGVIDDDNRERRVVDEGYSAAVGVADSAGAVEGATEDEALLKEDEGEVSREE